MRVLAGFEQGAASRDALALARALRDEAGAELVVASAPARGPSLEQRAAAEGADLVVLGPGERVRDGAGCAVAFASRGLAEGGFRLGRVATAYDGSREAGVALDLAASLAERAGASLLIVSVVERNDGAESYRGEEERMRRHLDRVQERLPASLSVEKRLVHGHVGDALLEAARDADLLVVGSRSTYGAVHQLFLGSVSRRLLDESPCSTLVATTA